MANQSLQFLCLSLFVALASASCNNPTITATSFTTQDATILTNIAYISQFQLQCDGETADIPLYAEVGGKSVSVVRGKETNTYQASWSEEIKKAARGNFVIHVYDDEGYAALRKAQRSGEDASAVKPLSTVILNHPGAYNGPWINSELAAFALAVGVYYYAFSAKAKLVA